MQHDDDDEQHKLWHELFDFSFASESLVYLFVNVVVFARFHILSSVLCFSLAGTRFREWKLFEVHL